MKNYNILGIIFWLICNCLLANFAIANEKKFSLSDELIQKTSNFEKLLKEAHRYHQHLGTKSKPDTYIVGGRLANTEEFPTAVALIEGPGTTFCSGNLIAPNLIATAGHCALNLFREDTNDFKSLKGRLGAASASVNLEKIEPAIENLVNDNKHTIHVRILDKNYFDIVESVAVSSSWLQWNADIANYYLTGTREIRFNSNSVSDKAIIKLKRSFDEIAIVPMINQKELESVGEQQYKKAVQVGYGYIKDPTLIEKAAKNDADAKRQLLDLMDKKYLVELPVNTVLNISEGWRVGIGKPGKAACYGDSGGPTFVQLQSGQWRYLASLSKSVSRHGLCGENDQDAWKDTASKQTKQTTDIADVWIR
jgi:hypothetical protein